MGEFYAVGVALKEVFYAWIYIVDSPENAKNYECTMSMTSPDGKRKIIDQGLRVFTLDDDEESITEKGSVFSVRGKTAEEFRNEDGGLVIEIKIRNLKEEAKD